jgi:hypothetical protein
LELETFRAGLRPASGRRSLAADWCENRRWLVGVSRHGSGGRSLELLAFGLQGLDGRELHLVVPEIAVRAIRARAAWLTAKVYVHKSHGKSVGPAEAAMSPCEAIRYYRLLGGLTQRVPFDTSSWPAWLADLVNELEGRGIARTQTTRTVVWRYRGRQLLSVRPARSGSLALTAGAAFTSSGRDRPAPIRRTVASTTTLTTAELKEFRSVINTAINRRRTGQDPGHRERLLQAVLSSDPALIGMTYLEREVPAWRPRYKPSKGRAFIDLLGRDVDRTGHVIETKLRRDPQLGIQALDYWAWAHAHRPDLARSINADPARPFHLDLVLGGQAADWPLRPAAAATLQALRPEIRWRCHRVTEWDTIAEPKRPLTPKAEALPPRQLPD